MAKIITIQGKTLYLGSENSSIKVNGCIFYDSFELEDEDTKYSYHLDDFGLTQNTDQSISTKDYCYKILAIIKDKTKRKHSRYVVVGQYFRPARDRCVPDYKDNLTKEVLCTDALELVSVFDFIQPTAVYEGLAAVPKDDADPYSCFQHRYFVECANVIEDSKAEVFIGPVQLVELIKRTYGDRYISESDEPLHSKIRELMNSDQDSETTLPRSRALKKRKERQNEKERQEEGENPAKKSSQKKFEQENTREEKSGRKNAREDWQISPIFRNFVDNFPTQFRDLTSADCCYLRNIFRDWKDNLDKISHEKAR